MNTRILLIILFLGVAVVGWSLGRYTAGSDNSSTNAEFSMEMIPHPNLARLGKESQAQVNAARTQCGLLLEHPKSTDPLLRARAVAELGKYYYAYNFFDSAAACFQLAQDWQPTEFRWPYLLGQAHRMNGKMNLAAESIERAMAIVPLDMSVPKQQGIAMVTWLGEIYLGDNQVEKAELYLQRALKEDNECGIALMKLGELAAAGGDSKQAIALFERVLKQTPNAKNVLLLLAAEYQKNGETAKAEQILKRAQQLRDAQNIPRPDPLMAELNRLDESHQKYNRSGNKALAAGRLQRALALYERGLESAPDNDSLLVNAGNALDRLGDHQQARDMWLRVLSAGPNENALRLLGQSHFRSGNHEQSLAYIQQALDLKPNDASFRFMLASVQSHAGHHEEALRAFGDVLVADPAHARAHLGEIRMLAALGRCDAALERAQRCQQEFPEFAGGTLALARLLAACPNDHLRDGKRALELCRPLYDAKKTVASAETVAMAYAEVGDFPKAVEAQNWAVQRLAPTNMEDAKSRSDERLKMYENQQACRQPWAPDAAYPSIARPVEMGDEPDDSPTKEADETGVED